MADEGDKITELTQMTTAVGTDRIPIVDDPAGTPETQYIEVEDLVTSIAASAATTTTGTATTSVVTPDGLAGSSYGKVVVQADLCNSATLTTANKAYIRVPAKINGWNLVGVAASCGAASSSGAVTITVSNGATSMLSTNLTIDQSETDSSTAATAAVIDTAQDDVATGDQIIIAVTGAGTGVTYCVVELTFQLP